MVLLFETLAMFAYVYALTCSRNSEEIEDQAIGSALLCVAILSRLNGANINLSITLAHILRR